MFRTENLITYVDWEIQDSLGEVIGDLTWLGLKYGKHFSGGYKEKRSVPSVYMCLNSRGLYKSSAAQGKDTRKYQRQNYEFPSF